MVTFARSDTAALTDPDEAMSPKAKRKARQRNDFAIDEGVVLMDGPSLPRLNGAMRIEPLQFDQLSCDPGEGSGSSSTASRRKLRRTPTAGEAAARPEQNPRPALCGAHS